jgi:hypothetical protein
MVNFRKMLDWQLPKKETALHIAFVWFLILIGKKILREKPMCKNIIFSNAGVNNLYQAAKQAKAEGGDPLTAARTAAEKEGTCDQEQQVFLDNLANDPDLLGKINEDVNGIEINGTGQSATPVQTNIDFVGNQESPAQEVKTHKPVNSNILHPGDHKLAETLKKYAGELDSTPGGRQSLIDKAKEKASGAAKTNDEKESSPLYAENRTKDFLHVLDKAREGKKLNRNDVQSIQTYLYFDTEHGKNLSKKGDYISAADGLYGPRTNTALGNVISELKNK